MQNPRFPQIQHTNPSEQKLDTIRKEAHTTYNVNYHFVWIPKYRRQVLREKGVRNILEQIIRGHSESHNWQVLAFEMQPDHIHLFVSVPPKDSPSYVVKTLKAISSIQLRRIFPEMTAKYGLHSNHFWAKGYFVSTAGYISEDKVKRYIDEQMKHARMHDWNLKHPRGKQNRLN